MKKKNVQKYVAIVIVFAMMGSGIVSATLVQNNHGVQEEKSYVNEGETTITVPIPIGSYTIKESEQRHEISVENFGRLMIPGKPDLPSKIFAIAIPPGADVTDVTFDLGEEIQLSGTYTLDPVPLPRVIGKENPVFSARDMQIYEANVHSVYRSNEPYPSSIGEFVRTAGFRKYNLVDVRITPFTYRPLSGLLTYYPNIIVRIHYTFPEDFSSDAVMVDNSPWMERTAKEIILNYDQAQKWYPQSTGGRDSYDYVIITLDSLTSSVTPLVDWETSKGRSVNVVTTSWINSAYSGYDLAEKIRNFLRDKYPSSAWGIRDVLIVGNRNNVPMRRTWQDLGYGKPETDFYYAELTKSDSQSWDSNQNHRWGENSDAIDFYNEVNVGRIPWSTPADVLHICEKSVAYEQNNDPAFKKNILLLGAFFWDNDPNPRTDNAVLMEAKVNQAWMADWTKTRMYEQGYSSYPMDYNLNYNNVRSVWSAGKYAFVNWAGHGSEYGSYIYHSTGEAFVYTSTSPYLNDNYPAIIFADACSNSDTDYTNLGQVMMKQGAVGFVGATKVALGCPGWSNPNSGSSQSLDYYFTTRVTQGNYTQGDAHQWALRQMYTRGLWDYLRYETFEWGALWGNPDLRMEPVVINYPPETPQQLSGVTKGAPGVEYEFSAVTTDPEGDNISYLFDWGDGTDSGWLGPYASGGTCIASHSWINPGIYEVKVKAKDTFEHESGWSDPVSVTIFTCGDTNGDGTIDSADVVYLINYLFIGGPEPVPDLCVGDVNGDGVVNISDVVYLINYLFINEPPPGGCCK
jgi:hypothetical protein